MAINPDALATGFEECMSTFSQEMRALNHVRIVVMEILVYDMQPRVCVCYALVGAMGRTFVVSPHIIFCYFTTNTSFPPLLLCLWIPSPFLAVQRRFNCLKETV